METLNKAPSADLSQVFLSFSHAIGPCPSSVLFPQLCGFWFSVSAVGKVRSGYAGYAGYVKAAWLPDSRFAFLSPSFIFASISFDLGIFLKGFFPHIHGWLVI